MPILLVSLKLFSINNSVQDEVKMRIFVKLETGALYERLFRSQKLRACCVVYSDKHPFRHIVRL